jgi:hypothetical protein
MYIDAEHSSAACLGKVLAQFDGLARPDTRKADQLQLASKDTPVHRKPPAAPDRPAPAIASSSAKRAPAQPLLASTSGSDAAAGHAQNEIRTANGARNDLPSGAAEQATPMAETSAAPHLAAGPAGFDQSGRDLPVSVAVAQTVPVLPRARSNRAAGSLPPLPVRKSIALPPLPTKRPMIGAVDCVWPGVPHRVSDNPSAPKRAAKRGARS